jgi:hypothetical protein
MGMCVKALFFFRETDVHLHKAQDGCGIGNPTLAAKLKNKGQLRSKNAAPTVWCGSMRRLKIVRRLANISWLLK